MVVGGNFLFSLFNKLSNREFNTVCLSAKPRIKIFCKGGTDDRCSPLHLSQLYSHPSHFTPAVGPDVYHSLSQPAVSLAASPLPFVALVFFFLTPASPLKTSLAVFSYHLN